MNLIEAVNEFSDEAKAEAWFVQRRWKNGIRCPYCDSENISPRTNGRKTPAYRCNPCKRDFTVKTGTIMHDSKLPLSTWAMAFYLMSTRPKGVSSMQLHRDLGITQKSAWHLAHRIRETWNDEVRKFAGPVEVDETYVGGRETNKHADKKLKAGRGAVGKTGVVGLRDRATGQVASVVIPDSKKATLQGFVLARTTPETTVYTDEFGSYVGLPRPHETISHGKGEYVRDDVSTNGIESHWATLKRGHYGTYHQMSPKHLQRYANEFSGRHNQRGLEPTDRMGGMVASGVGQRLPYAVLVRPVPREGS